MVFYHLHELFSQIEKLLISQSQSKLLESVHLYITSHACNIMFQSTYRLLWFGKVPPRLHTIFDELVQYTNFDFVKIEHQIGLFVYTYR